MDSRGNRNDVENAKTDNEIKCKAPDLVWTSTPSYISLTMTVLALWSSRNVDECVEGDCMSSFYLNGKLSRGCTYDGDLEGDRRKKCRRTRTQKKVASASALRLENMVHSGIVDA